MKYKEFSAWCTDRAADGCWAKDIAIYCLRLCGYIDSFAFWKREKIWRKEYEAKIVNTIIEPLDKMRIEMYGK